MAKSIEIVDLDVYGRNASGGGGLLHRNDMAVSNAIVHYLNTGTGDYLYSPKSGGNVKKQIFKLMNTTQLGKFIKITKDEIDKNFGEIVSDIEVDIIPDFETATLEVFITWTQIETGESNDLSFFLSMPSNLQKMPRPENIGSYIPIEFTGNTLLAFVVLEKEKPEMQNVKMVYDLSLSKYIWPPYKFTNFTEESSVFDDIDTLIGI